MRRYPEQAAAGRHRKLAKERIQVRAAHRQQFAAAAIEHLVGIESLHGVAGRRRGQGSLDRSGRRTRRREMVLDACPILSVGIAP